MKRVLLITYYWPPAGGGGVMRWLKMGKYLSEMEGVELTVFCPKEANYLIADLSLEEQVPKQIRFIKQPIWEPNSILLRLGFKRFLKDVASGGVGKQKKKGGLKQSLLIWVRSNLFIPDARAFWIKPSIKRLKKEVKKQRFDAVISTGPPHSTHLIALGLKREFQVPWIADFRDPWTFIDFFEDLSLSEKSRKKHLQLEQNVLDSADKVITVSQSWAKRFQEKTKTDVQVITNGYDPEDFKPETTSSASAQFTLCHIGSLNKDRSAPIFWEAVSELCAENKAFEKQVNIQIIGSVSADLNEQIGERGLEKQVELISHLPHKEVLSQLTKAHCSLLFINNTSNKGGIIPGKLFEYLAARNPILCVGNKEGDSAEIIRSAQAGKVFDFNDKQGIKAELAAAFESFQLGKPSKLDGGGIEKYSRKNLAKQYLSLLNELTLPLR